MYIILIRRNIFSDTKFKIDVVYQYNFLLLYNFLFYVGSFFCLLKYDFHAHIHIWCGIQCQFCLNNTCDYLNGIFGEKIMLNKKNENNINFETINFSSSKN